jgi:hypothetical protein
MNQNDFRALLAQSVKRTADAPTAAGVDAAAKPKPKFKPRTQRKDNKDDDAAAAASYRDRAAERRKGIKTDETEEHILQSIDIERSKFLVRRNVAT